MLPQRNAVEKIHTKIVWCATPEGYEEVELVTLNSRGEGVFSEKKNKKMFSGVYPISEVSKSAIHSNFIC